MHHRPLGSSRAGHRGPDGTAEIPDIPVGPPLGVTSAAPFTTGDVVLEEGSILALSSSPAVAAHLAAHPGLLRRPEEAAGPDADADAGRPLADLCDDILYSLPAGLSGRADALLLTRTRPFPAHRVASWRLEPDPAAVSAARHHAGEQLAAAWRIEGDIVFNTELIVSELVTNAIRHGTPPLALRLINDRALTCEVRDAGPAARACATPAPSTRAAAACPSPPGSRGPGAPATTRRARRSGRSQPLPRRPS